jgi:hypothetical protein
MTKSLPEIRRLRAKGLNVGELRQPRAFSTRQHDLPWACDNDGFQGVNIPRFLKMLATVANQDGCLFVLSPDVVGDWEQTESLWATYAPVIRACGLPVGYALQNGVPFSTAAVSLSDALFIGGDDEFKYSEHVKSMVRVAKLAGQWVHMGRVNSISRIRYAGSIGCDSIDGTKWSRFTDTYAHQLHALPFRQEALA